MTLYLSEPLPCHKITLSSFNTVNCVFVCGRVYKEVRDSVQWFLLATEDTHVDFNKLGSLLQKYNSEEVNGKESMQNCSHFLFLLYILMYISSLLYSECGGRYSGQFGP